MGFQLPREHLRIDGASGDFGDAAGHGYGKIGRDFYLNFAAGHVNSDVLIAHPQAVGDSRRGTAAAAA